MKKVSVLLFALLLAAGCNSQKADDYSQNQSNQNVPEANIQTQAGTVNVLEELNMSLSEEDSLYAQSDSDLLKSDAEIINSYNEVYNAN